MTPAAIDKAARLLAEARLARRAIADLPPDCRPETVEDGYAVQDRLADILGFAVGGWFAACTNVEIQRKLGLPGPYSARLFEHALRPSPAVLSAGEFFATILECEFAFRLARDLPGRSRPYGRDEVADAISSVHPAIEVVCGHFEDWPDKPIAYVIADNGTDGALIYGAGVSDWRGLDLARVPVSLRVGGEVVRAGSGANVLGDPLDALVWLANERSARGNGLRAGHIHNTGTATSMFTAGRGDEAVADFGPLGETRLSIGP